ncbi:MAG TPA: hypothetical protein VLW26_06525 [Steroidobacteraceae bacterium]|nr:hypothetical protein [Steroidobacteraceae bacterium]
MISDDSAKQCSSVANKFQTFERVLRDLAGLDEDTRLKPIVVYVLSDSDSRRVFLSDADKRTQNSRGMRISSKVLPGTDYDIAAFIDNDTFEQSMQGMMLLTAESVLMSGPTRGYPPWYLFGVSNVLNGLLIKPDGTVILSRSGPFQPDTDHASAVKYDLAKLLSTTARDLRDGGDLRSFALRARDWAQYGLLTTPERRARYRDLTTLMRQGTPAEEAVPQAFGMPLAAVAKDFDDSHWKSSAQFTLPAPKSSAAAPVPEKLDPTKVDELLKEIADRVTQQAPRS